LAACGYDYHGPHGHLGFAPRLTPENFRAAFTAAEGWGTFSQKAEGGRMKAEIAVKWGKLRLKTLALALPENSKPPKISVTLDGKPVRATHTQDAHRLHISLAAEANLEAGHSLGIETA